ncbi:MAG TPA: PKD domain-containing protein [Nitrospirae bacterium]|nr:PKD domain-containing protein [Nitrospirota bacterium]HDL19685.1 PKD domain-containing protein [Nitrospirota bacterium]HDZ03089.1 PKD domain-containing protein [Nitrospirota bacterium]
MNKKNVTHLPVIFLAVSVFLLFCFVNVSQAIMPVYERLTPITDNVSAPTAVALDIYENLYVTESSNNRLLIYSQSGRYIETLTGLHKPISVAVDDTGRIFIGNKHSENVEVYDSDLNLLFKLGSGDGEFEQPNAIAIDSSGRIYVVDKEEDIVKVYNPDGSFSFSFGGSGSGNGLFDSPTSIAIDEIAGELIISDLQIITDMYGGEIEGARIQVLDMNGVYKRSFGGYGVGDGLMTRPLGLTVDGESRVYITDTLQHVVHVFESNGTFLGTMMDPNNQVRTPLGITIGNSNRIFIASLNTSKIEVYGIDLYTDMKVTPVYLSFEGQVGGVDPVLQNVNISNDGAGTLNWTAVANESWITLSATSGSLAPLAVSNISIGVSLAGLTAGTYAGSVSISADSGATEVLNIDLTVSAAPSNSPPNANAGGQYSGIEGQAIILDASGSFDPDGTISLYEWDIDNDGIYDYSSTLPTQSHTYVQQGTYAVVLRVTDDFGETDGAVATAVISDSSPAAAFTGTPTSGTVPLTINFTDNSTGYDQPLSHEWDFDNDGVIDSTLRNPSYTYNSAGTYTVSLTVMDSDGSTNSLTRMDYITACLSPVRISGATPVYYSTLQAAYDAAVDGDIIQSRDLTFTENLNINRNISITLKGGYDCGYTAVTGKTTLSGTMTVSDGIVATGDFVLQ